MSTPRPLVILAISSARFCFVGSIIMSAPQSIAYFAIYSEGSETMIFPAPFAFISRMRYSPIGPPPRINTVSPGRTLTQSIAPITHFTGSAKIARSLSISSGIFVNATSGATKYFANTPSQVTPITFSFSHMFAFPCRHDSQYPHGIFGTRTTLSPTFSPSTPSPISLTVPTHSCPRILPFVPINPGGFPSTCTSVPQILAASTSTNTSFTFLISGTDLSSYVQVAKSLNTIAFIFLSQ